MADSSACVTPKTGTLGRASNNRVETVPHKNVAGTRIGLGICAAENIAPAMLEVFQDAPKPSRNRR